MVVARLDKRTLTKEYIEGLSTVFYLAGYDVTETDDYVQIDTDTMWDEDSLAREKALKTLKECYLFDV